ncbi:hypothetical protein CDO73_25065 [Saccharibacillus sp. O23]|uniref:S-layer homology domain-containing protein n=1 Tax=Saccharibacillus sp. O23 TaxID=2009338 RepID=UPI000B4E66B0|nr:S-layer homology domain-containing protein [Saccharibacillus sp. O23]OWR26663.1 hypothetical protein CDO73_25065 [Saccharibacillus sp. O23]
MMITRTAFIKMLLSVTLTTSAAYTFVPERDAYAEDAINEAEPSVPIAQTEEPAEEPLKVTDMSTAANDSIVEIANVSDLDSIAVDLGGHFRLTGDIDAAGYATLSTATFTGTLEGNGHRIAGLDGSVPLFAALNGATISDVEIPIYSSSAGVRAAFAVGVTNSTLQNLIVSNADLHYSLPDGADLNGQDGALFSTVSDSTIRNLQLNVPSLTWDKGFAATGILAKDLTRVNMDQVFFGDMTLHGRGSFIAEASVLAGNVTDLTVSKATGNITLSSFSSVYGFGILGARTKGTMNVTESALNLRLVDVESANSTATLFSRSVDANYTKQPTTIHVESSSLGFESVSPTAQLAQVSTTSGSDAGDQTTVNIRNSRITFRVPDSKKIQNSAAGALNGGVFEHSDFQIDMVSDSLFIVGGASLNLNEAIDNTFAVDLKSRRELFSVSGVVQGPLNRLSGGTVKATIHSDVPNDANVMFIAGIAYEGNIIQDTTADIRIKAQTSDHLTNKGVTFVNGLFASSATSAPDGLTIRNLKAQIDLDLNVPTTRAYSGYHGMAPNVFTLADSKIDVRMRIAGTDLTQMYLINTLKEASDNEISFDFEGNISGQASAIIPIQEYGKVERNIFNFSTSVQADDINNVYGLARTGSNSVDNTFNIKLNQQATAIRDAYGLMSILNGSFDNNKVNAEMITDSTRQERTHLISSIGGDALMRNNTMKVTGSLTGVSDWWAYSLFSSIADTAVVENLAIRKDLRLDTGISPKAELVRYISNATVKGLAFQSANEPLPFEGVVGTDSTGTYTDSMTYRDSYFIYPEQNEYLKILPEYIAMKDCYVRFLDTEAGILFVEKANAVSDMLNMEHYEGLDPALWQKQTTNGIDSPRLAWLMAQEPSVFPEGKFEDGKVTVSWRRNDPETAYTAWQEGEAESVQKVHGSDQAIFKVPNTAKEARAYKVAQVGNWGIAVPQNEYVYDPSSIHSPIDPATSVPTPTLPETVSVTMPTEVNPPLEVTLAEEQGGKLEAEEPPKYIDVPKEHFAYKEITELDAKGVIKGYVDRSFRPDASITRAEFAVMLARAFQAPASESAFRFADLADGAWYDQSLRAALAAGITKGFNDGKYRPLHAIPREQAVIMVTNLLQQHNIYKNRAIQFTDLKEAVEWSRYAIVSAASAGAIEGYPDGTFRPKAAITRAEAAVIVKRLLKTLDR